jgi:hypothetical protein
VLLSFFLSFLFLFVSFFCQFDDTIKQLSSLFPPGILIYLLRMMD